MFAPDESRRRCAGQPTIRPPRTYRDPIASPPHPRAASTIAPWSSLHEPDPDHVLEHVEGAADRAYLGRRRVAPHDRHLGDLHPLLAGAVQHLGVVAEPIRDETREHAMRDVGAKKLETALRVPDPWQQDHLHDEVERLAHGDAVDGL